MLNEKKVERLENIKYQKNLQWQFITKIDKFLHVRAKTIWTKNLMENINPGDCLPSLSLYPLSV